MSIAAKTSALEVSERVQALERAAGRNFGRRGSRGEKSRGPRQNFGAGSLEIVQSHILVSSSRSLSWFRGRHAIAYHIATGSKHQHRWEKLRRTCHVHLINKRHVSQRWRHEQQLSGVGLRRQVLRPHRLSDLCVSSENNLKRGLLQVLRKIGRESSSLARLAVRASRAAFHFHPRSQHAMWSSPRSRARFLEPVSVELWRRYQRQR